MSPSESTDPQGVTPARINLARWRPIALFAIVSLALAVGGYWYYRHEMHEIQIEKHQDLEAIAGLKIEQFVKWRGERMADVTMLSTETFFRSAVARWRGASSDSELQAGIRKTLETMGRAYRYDNIILASADGVVLVSLDPRLSVLDASAKQMAAQAVSSRGPVFNDFFRCVECNQAHLDVGAPILDEGGQPCAVLILRSDPEEYLYPLIQSWPTPSPTGETLLVRKDGDDVLYLNQLRHRPDPALTLRIPLSNHESPAVRAVRGESGEFEGEDYRGVRVLAHIRSVPDSPWFMVAKVDKSEILAEARYRGLIVLLIVVLAIVMAGSAAALIFNYRQRLLYRDLYQAERWQREAQEEIRTTLYSIGDAVIATDAASRVARMNPTAEQLTGWREADALGKPLEEVFHIINEKTEAVVENPAARVIREGTVVGLANHTLLIARNGAVRPIADSGAPIRDEEGQITGAVLVFRDQTEERRAQRALHESRERYRTTLYSIGDAVIATDVEGRVRQMNAIAETLTGWREAEAAGRPLEQVFRIVNEETRAEVENPVTRVIREQTIVGLANHTLLIARDGSERPIADSGSPIRDEEGRIVGVVLVFRDQSDEREVQRALRESEDRYRSLFEGMTEGFALHEIVCDEAGKPCDYRFLDLNPAFEELTGLKRDDVIGRTVREVLPGEDPAWIETYGAVALTGQPARFGSYSTALDRHFDVFAYSPAPGRFAVLFSDVTEQRRAAEEQRRLEAQILHAQKLESLGVLAGGIAHDFNNILAGIRGYADLALTRLAPSEAACADLEEIKSAAHRAALLTRQMLAYSGKGKRVVEALDLSRVVEDSKRMLEMSVSKQAVLKFDLAPRLPIVQADAAQMCQVLMNLVINASESLGEHGGVISVSTHALHCETQDLAGMMLGKELPEGLYVCLEVADTGGGMDQATLDKVFDPFFTTKFTGRGLGLATVHGIVRSHGGAIQVASELGHGTSFLVLLPAREGPDASLARAGQVAESRARHSSGGTVLVVDDEEVIRATTGAFFERAGFQVLTAADGAEALEIYCTHRNRIVCVVLDLTMPTMGGEEVLRELRLIDPKIRVIITSGHAEEDIAERFAGQEVFGVVAKPDPIGPLIAKLQEALAEDAS